MDEVLGGSVGHVIIVLSSQILQGRLQNRCKSIIIRDRYWLYYTKQYQKLISQAEKYCIVLYHQDLEFL